MVAVLGCAASACAALGEASTAERRAATMRANAKVLGSSSFRFRSRRALAAPGPEPARPRARSLPPPRPPAAARRAPELADGGAPAEAGKAGVPSPPAPPADARPDDRRERVADDAGDAVDGAAGRAPAQDPGGPVNVGKVSEGLDSASSATMPGDALGGLGLVPTSSAVLRSRRKMSTPAALLSDHQAMALAQMAAMAPRRRFSNVSDAVSRKLSSTIGWRTAPAHSKIVEIVSQGKALCGQYMRSRLKRAGLFDRKCGLQRLRSAAALHAPQGLSGAAGTTALRELFSELNAVGLELERRHPKVYTGVARQAAAGPIVSDKAAASALTAVGRDLLKQEMTWGKVVSLFAVAGGLAVDCARQGHPEYLHALVAAVGQLLEDDLAPWIADNGGWVALAQHCTRGVADGEVPVAVVAGLICAVMAAVLGAVLALRVFGKFALI